MASGFSSNCHLPVFCLPFPDSIRTSNSAHNVQANGGSSRTSADNEFTVPTTLHSQLYREYSNNYTNGVRKDLRPQSEFRDRKITSSLNGGEYSPIFQTSDSIISGTNNYSHEFNEEEKTMQISTTYETHRTVNTGSAVGLSKLFTRFGKRRKSSSDLREYFSDTEREVKGKNKGKLRY